jgi:hypothetical protein
MSLFLPIEMLKLLQRTRPFSIFTQGTRVYLVPAQPRSSLALGPTDKLCSLLPTTTSVYTPGKSHPRRAISAVAAHAPSQALGATSTSSTIPSLLMEMAVPTWPSLSLSTHTTSHGGSSCVGEKHSSSPSSRRRHIWALLASASSRGLPCRQCRATDARTRAAYSHAMHAAPTVRARRCRSCRFVRSPAGRSRKREVSPLFFSLPSGFSLLSTRSWQQADAWADRLTTLALCPTSLVRRPRRAAEEPDPLRVHHLPLRGVPCPPRQSQSSTPCAVCPGTAVVPSPPCVHAFALLASPLLVQRALGRCAVLVVCPCSFERVIVRHCSCRPLVLFRSVRVLFNYFCIVADTN